MAQWRKVIVSGSNSELNNISSSGDFVMSKDGAKMKFGADNEVTLTHQHNDGLLLSDQSGIGTTKLSFGDTATFVQQSADGTLNVQADTLINMTGNVSMSADLNVVGDIHAEGNITFQAGSGGNITLGSGADDNISAAGDFISSLIPNADDSFDLGSDAQRWNNLYLSGSISASGGAHDIDSATTIDIDSVGATSIDAGAASNFSTSAGALTLSGAGGVNIAGSNQEIDITTTGAVDINSAGFDVDASGAVGIDSDSTVTVGGSAVDIDADGGKVSLDGSTGIDIGTATDTAIDIDSSTLDIDASGAITMDSTSTIVLSGDAGATLSDDTEGLAYDGSGNVDFDAVALDIDASDNITITAGGSGKIVDIDASGVLSLDGAGGINVGHTADTAIDIESSTFDIDASGAITIDGTALSIDGTAASNVTVTGNDLTLSTATSGNVIMDSAGTVGIGTTSATAITIGRDGITTTINGDLDVNGTLTTIDTTNLQIKDAFVQVASGSTSSTNGGLIVNTTADGSGSAFYYDGDVDRWSLTKAGDTGHTDVSVAPRQFVTTVSQSAVPPGTTPGDFGNSDASRRGMIHIQTADDADTKSVEGDIWIYS